MLRVIYDYSNEREKYLFFNEYLPFFVARLTKFCQTKDFFSKSAVN